MVTDLNKDLQDLVNSGNRYCKRLLELKNHPDLHPSSKGQIEIAYEDVLGAVSILQHTADWNSMIEPMNSRRTYVYQEF